MYGTFRTPANRANLVSYLMQKNDFRILTLTKYANFQFLMQKCLKRADKNSAGNNLTLLSIYKGHYHVTQSKSKMQ